MFRLAVPTGYSLCRKLQFAGVVLIAGHNLSHNVFGAEPSQFAPVLIAAAPSAALTAPRTPSEWESVFGKWRQAYDRGDYVKAEQILRQALKYADLPGANPKYVGKTLSSLIATLYAEKKYTEAKPLYDRSLTVVAKMRGENSPELASALKNYSALLRKLGDAAGAEVAEGKAETILAMSAAQPSMQMSASTSSSFRDFFNGSNSGSTKPSFSISSSSSPSTAQSKPVEVDYGSGAAMDLQEGDFEAKVLHAEGLVLVDFYATWCGPCKRMMPIVDGAAQKYAGRLTVYRVDVDQAKSLSGRFQISSIPTFIFFRDGNPLESRSGGSDKQSFEQNIDRLLSQN